MEMGGTRIGTSVAVRHIFHNQPACRRQLSRPTASDRPLLMDDGDAPQSYVLRHVHIIRETLPNGRSYETIGFGPGSEDDFPRYKVPAEHVFVMGDNQDMSAGSRVPVEMNGLDGAVPIENIGGRAEVVTFSLNGSATWNPLTWFSMFRNGRAGTSLHPRQGTDTRTPDRPAIHRAEDRSS